MALLAEKLVHFLKFSCKPEESSASLLGFRSKTSNLLSQILLKPAGPEAMNEAWFKDCFEMMHAANRAFSELAVEIDYPMSQWGGAATHHYLGYTLSLLDMLNSITSCLSHINMVKISMLHGLSLVESSPISAANYLMKRGGSSVAGDFHKVEKYAGMIEMRAGSLEKEGVIVEALMELRKIGLFALGLVLSGLQSAKSGGGCDDPLKRAVESRFCRGMKGVEEEVSCAAERLAAAISAGEKQSCDEEGVRELKRELEVMENAMLSVEKEVNYLFSEVLAARNKALNNIRF